MPWGFVWFGLVYWEQISTIVIKEVIWMWAPGDIITSYYHVWHLWHHQHHWHHHHRHHRWFGGGLLVGGYFGFRVGGVSQRFFHHEFRGESYCQTEFLHPPTQPTNPPNSPTHPHMPLQSFNLTSSTHRAHTWVASRRYFLNWIFLFDIGQFFAKTCFWQGTCGLLHLIPTREWRSEFLNLFWQAIDLRRLSPRILLSILILESDESQGVSIQECLSPRILILFRLPNCDESQGVSVQDVEEPEIVETSQVLIEVRAASLDPVDLKVFYSEF